MKRILLMHLRDLGDVIVSTPAIRAIRGLYPDARIEFITGKSSIAALHGNPHLDETILWTRGPRHIQLMGLLALRRYDALVDFQTRRRSVQLSLASRAKIRVGARADSWRDRYAYTHVLPSAERARQYVARYKLEFLRPLGYVPTGNPADWRTELFPAPADYQWAEDFFDRHSLHGQPVVALAGVSLRHFKRWSPESWASAADALIRSGARVVLTNSPREVRQVAEIVAHMQEKPIWDYGKTTVMQVAALYSRCALWIGNDGGAKHIAAAMGTPSIAVHRWRNSPIWTDDARAGEDIALERVPTLLCLRQCSTCSHYSCLRDIKVEDLVEPALEILRAWRPAGPSLTTTPHVPQPAASLRRTAGALPVLQER
jgi:heptosyltransferase-3